MIPTYVTSHERKSFCFRVSANLQLESPGEARFSFCPLFAISDSHLRQSKPRHAVMGIVEFSSPGVRQRPRCWRHRLRDGRCQLEGVGHVEVARPGKRGEPASISPRIASRDLNANLRTKNSGISVARLAWTLMLREQLPNVKKTYSEWC